MVEPFGAHPSYVQGYYDRDNGFYTEWEDVSRDPQRLSDYLDKYVYGVRDRRDYIAKLPGLVERLKAQPKISAGVDYGF